MSADLPTPSVDEVDLSAVLAALADPLRRAVIVDLLARPDGEHACASFDLPVAKSTRTHHWRVLRQAGLIHQRDAGNGSYVHLRSEFAARFPGLLESIRDAHHASRTMGDHQQPRSRS
jgi:DNA-binding transcriptional ArsR family regulator